MKGEEIKKIFQSKTARTILICIIALALLFAVWKVFFGGEKKAISAYQPTDQEARLALLLSEIEGVDDVTVMIGEENGAPVSVVVVFKGTDDFLTRMRLTSAAASVLNIAQTKVLVYPSV